MRDVTNSTPLRNDTKGKSFWSVARKEDRQDSDVDQLVKFCPNASLRDDEAIKSECRALFGRRVDVVRNTAVLRDSYFAARACPEAIRI